MGKGEPVVMESGCGLIVRTIALDTLCEPLSATWTVKFAVPALEGVPAIIPPSESVSPAGKAPAVSDHAYGGVPPVADSVCEYCTLTGPVGIGDAVVIESGEIIVRDKALDAVCEALSAT